MYTFADLQHDTQMKLQLQLLASCPLLAISAIMSTVQWKSNNNADHDNVKDKDQVINSVWRSLWLCGHAPLCSDITFLPPPSSPSQQYEMRLLCSFRRERERWRERKKERPSKAREREKMLINCWPKNVKARSMFVRVAYAGRRPFSQTCHRCTHTHTFTTHICIYPRYAACMDVLLSNLITTLDGGWKIATEMG